MAALVAAVAGLRVQRGSGQQQPGALSRDRVQGTGSFITTLHLATLQRSEISPRLGPANQSEASIVQLSTNHSSPVPAPRALAHEEPLPGQQQPPRRRGLGSANQRCVLRLASANERSPGCLPGSGCRPPPPAGWWPGPAPPHSCQRAVVGTCIGFLTIAATLASDDET